MPTVDLNRYLRLLWAWTWLFILAAGVSGGVSYMSVRKLPRTYVSSTTLMVGDLLQNANPNSSDFSTAQYLASAYAQMTTTEPILEATAKALNLPEGWTALQQQVVVVHFPGAQTFEVRVVDVDPQRAQRIAAEVAKQIVAASPTEERRKQLETRQRFVLQQLDDLQAKIQKSKAELDKKQAELAKETSARAVLDREDEIKALQLNIDNWQGTYAKLLESYGQGSSPNDLTIVSPAQVPVFPQGPKTTWNVALAALAGFLLAFVAVLGIEALDDTIRNKDDLEVLGAKPLLGVLAAQKLSERGAPSLLIVDNPESVVAEGYRALATSVRFVSPAGAPSAILITSAAPSEGKSTLAANLAIALAQIGKKVLLVDLDLRKPALTELFNVVDKPGVTSLAVQPTLVATECFVDTPVAGLKLLPRGPSVTSHDVSTVSSAFIVSRFLERLATELRSQAEVIIIDSSPVLAGSDASSIASQLDSTIFVVRAGVTTSRTFRIACEVLDRAQAHVVGVVLNAVLESSLGLHGYPYYPRSNSRLSLPSFPRFRRSASR